MRFDVVIGNVVPIFEKREQYEQFKRDMCHVGKIAKFMEPEEWIETFSQIEECKLYAELRYAHIYDSEYFTDQIEELIENIEYWREEDDEEVEINVADMMVAIAKQLIMLSEKVGELSEHIETIDRQINCDEDYLADQILEGLPDLSIDCEELAEEVAEKLKQGYIDDISELLQEKYRLGNRHSKSKKVD